jgi:hypothetical protein
MYIITYKKYLKEKVHKIMIFMSNDRQVIQLYPIGLPVDSCRISKARHV